MSAPILDPRARQYQRPNPYAQNPPNPALNPQMGPPRPQIHPQEAAFNRWSQDMRAQSQYPRDKKGQLFNFLGSALTGLALGELGGGSFRDSAIFGLGTAASNYQQQKGMINQIEQQIANARAQLPKQMQEYDKNALEIRSKQRDWDAAPGIAQAAHEKWIAEGWQQEIYTDEQGRQVRRWVNPRLFGALGFGQGGASGTGAGATNPVPPPTVVSDSPLNTAKREQAQTIYLEGNAALPDADAKIAQLDDMLQMFATEDVNVGMIEGTFQQFAGKLFGTKTANVNTRKAEMLVASDLVATAKQLGANPSDRDMELLYSTRPTDTDDESQWMEWLYAAKTVLERASQLQRERQAWVDAGYDLADFDTAGRNREILRRQMDEMESNLQSLKGQRTTTGKGRNRRQVNRYQSVLDQRPEGM